MAVRGVTTRAQGRALPWVKPVGGLSRNRLVLGHELAANLLSAVVLDGPLGIGGVEDYCGNLLTQSGAMAYSVGQFGLAASQTGTTGIGLNYPARLGGAVTNWSFSALCQFDGTSGATGQVLLSGAASGVMVSTFNGNTAFQVGDSSFGGGGAALTQTSAGLTGWHRITVTVSSALNVRFFIDGVLNQAATASGTMTGTGPASIVGDSASGSQYGNPWQWPVADAFYWNRTLTDQEVFEQFARPYDMIVPNLTARSIVGINTVTPDAGTLAFTGLAPTLVQGIVATPSVGSLVFSGLPPTVSSPPTTAVAPALGSLTITGLPPTVSAAIPFVVPAPTFPPSIYREGGSTLGLYPTIQNEVLASIAAVSGVPTPASLSANVVPLTPANRSVTLLGANPNRGFLLVYNPTQMVAQFALAASAVQGGLGNLSIGPGQAYFQATAMGLAPVYKGPLAAVGLFAPLPLWVWEDNSFLYNDGGVLAFHVVPNGWPDSPIGLPPGAFWNDGMAIAIALPGLDDFSSDFGPLGDFGTQPNPSAPPLFFGSVTAEQLLALGGADLPITSPGPGTLQLWNNNGLVSIA